VGAATGGSVGLSARLLYPLGFLIVIIGRSQLFTENTITPVTVVLTEFNVLPNMLQLWAVVFVANVLGTIVFAAALAMETYLHPAALEILFDEATTKLEYGFWLTTAKAILEVGPWRSWPGW
jgi:formate/nitrite transporter FocA (FNT family)